MDFSIFEPLLALREQVLEKTADVSAPLDKTSTDLLARVAQHRDRVLTLAARAAPAQIDEIFRAASAPLAPLPVEAPEVVAVSKALRLRKAAKPAAAKKAKKTTNTTKTAKAATTKK